MQRTFSFSGDSASDDGLTVSPTRRRVDLARSMSSLTLSPGTPNTSREISLAIIGPADEVSSLVSGMDGLNMSPAGIAGTEDTATRLQELVAGMRAKLLGLRPIGDRYLDHVRDGDVDGAYGYFVEVAGGVGGLCRGLLVDGREGLGGARVGGHRRAGSSVDFGVGVGKVRGVLGEMGVRRAVTDTNLGSGMKGEDGEGEGEGRAVDARWVNLVREWRACLEELAAALKMCLTNTYKRHEQFATPQILDALFADRKSRSQVVSGWMKNFGAYKRMQGHSGVWSKWETQFQNYDQVIHELAEITSLLQSVDSGIAPNRVIREHIIAPRGDTMLEFANAAMDWKPVLRFRVSSHMLSETSSIFAKMFNKHEEPEDGPEDDDQLPPPPTPFICTDGSRVLLYRMPQTELDRESSLTILLHAAHMHNDRVPRDISFPRFVALAEASLRYRCTSPLELFVEHRWLPKWIHKAQEDMPDGLVVISYAFGLRRLFTRVTKTAILNLIDEKELASKEWPTKIKERIWAVRCAKMAQVYGSCVRAVEEYLHPGAVADMEGSTVMGSRDSTPVGSPGRGVVGSLPSLFASASPLPPSFTSIPRCPKGSHWCDATNLGWLMLVFNELQILSTFLNPTVISGPTPPARSLAQIVGALRVMASPPLHPAHQGRLSSSVCDPAPAFRAAINDVYNSVAGLTLYEIDGTRHGWALSSHKIGEPQAVLHVSGARPGSAHTEIAELVGDTDATMGDVVETRESQGSPADEVFQTSALCLQILSAVDTFPDLHNLASTNRTIHTIYKTHELSLMRNLVRSNRQKPASISDPDTPTRPPPPTAIDAYLRKLSRQPPSQPQPIVIENTLSDIENAISDSDSETGTATPTSPIRSPAPSYSSLSSSVSVRSTSSMNPYFKMTEAEARQILWPEPSPPVSPQLSTPQVRAFATVSHVLEEEEEEGKFGGNGGVVREDKTLVVVGNKQLRDDLHRRIGLI